MKKKEQAAQGKQFGARKSKQTARALPSGRWLQGGIGIFRSLKPNERLILAGSVFLPLLDKLSKLGSIGIAIKIVVYGVKRAPDEQTRFLLGAAIFLAFGVAGAFQTASELTREKMDHLIATLVGRLYLETSPPAEGLRRLDQRKSNRLNKAATKGMRAAVGFGSSLALIALLVLLVGWFHPVIGVAVLILGVVVVNVLRLRSQSSQKNKRGAEVAKKNAENAIGAKAGETVDVSAPVGPPETARRLVIRGRRARKMRVGMVSNLLGAFVMAASFFLLSRAGALNEEKIAWIVVFCLGMRLLINEGESAIRWWLEMLDEKIVLMDLVIRSIKKSA